MQLRPYQEKAIADLRSAFKEKHSKVLLVAPTGAGKTVMFSYLTSQLTQRGHRVLLIAHRDFLLDQISETLSRFQIPHGFIAARRPLELWHLAQVAGVHTLKKRTSKITWTPDWIICDEAHHAVAGSWNAIIEAYPNAKVIGVTATPERLDGTGLGEVFERIVIGPQVQDLMDQGFLSRVRYISPQTVDVENLKTRMGDFTTADIERAVNKRGVTGHAVEWYTKVCGGLPAIAFCASIAHSEAVAEGFREGGYRWQALHSHASYADNQAAIAKLANGELHGISSCDIVSEGFDVPVVTAAILLRPTKSLGLHLQQIGRVLRPAPGKDRAIVIDHVGNVAKCIQGEWTMNHGRAEDAREWSLEGREKTKKLAPLKRCKACLAIIPASCSVCPECGEEVEVVSRELKQVEGTLAELPDTLPPVRHGYLGLILQIVHRDTESFGEDLAEQCMPPIPSNVFSQYTTDRLRKLAVESLAAYIYATRLREGTAQAWEDFEAAWKAYLKVITGALCSAARTLEEFEAIANLNGYKPGWAYHRFQSKNYARK
jgi:superfamily II DNA or RNA helicase